MSKKEGFFEWIVHYTDIRKFVHSKYMLNSTTEKYRPLKALVIGCGTSTVSSLLSFEEFIDEVVSIDNDKGCIDHMSQLHAENPKLAWYTYDLIEDIGVKQGNALDADGYFDIVVDKGTFDAVHVEGSVAPMLSEVRRFLCVGGIYVLCSINSTSFLSPLLCIPLLTFRVECHQINVSVYNVATVVVATKMADSPLDLGALAQQEREVADEHFKSEDPLLTPEFAEAINRRFAEAIHQQQHGQLDVGASGSSGSLPLHQAHEAIFGGDCGGSGSAGGDLLAYTLDLFLGDVAAFEELREPGRMTAQEALRFVADMQ